MEQRFGLANEAIVRAMPQELESLYSYPHPFTGPGLLAVVDRATRTPDAVARIRALLPSGSLHCLHRDELFTLAIPGQFIYILRSTPNEHPLVLYCLHRKGERIWGADLSAEFPPPPEIATVLEVHIERCLFYLRNNCILLRLMKRQYTEMIHELDLNLRHLMATALLPFNDGCVSPAAVSEAFQGAYADVEMTTLWRQFEALKSDVSGRKSLDCHREAKEAVWLFEQYVRRLRRLAV